MASSGTQSWRPGNRHPSAQVRGTGKMSEGRLAWLNVSAGHFVLLIQTEDEALGTSVRLLINRPGGKPFTINLTAMTEGELDKFQEFYTMVFDLARPVVLHRDRIANEASAQGDDSYSRVYRQVPQLVVRKGPQRANPEGVPFGLEGADEVACGHVREPGKPCAWCRIAGSRGLRGSGDVVAESGAKHSGPDDDEPTPRNV